MHTQSNDKVEEELASWLAACDDALASGAPHSSIREAAPPVDQHARVQRDLVFIQLLRGHWSGTWRASSSSDCQTSAVRSTDAHSPALPATIGRFQIKRELGQGGYGIVFLADDLQLSREVALKIPRADVLVTPELRARFHHEARAAASLDHSNIIQVYEAGEIGPICYIASAYCPGPTLAEWLKDRTEPVPFDAAAALIAALADAVQHAHSRGVLHRDLKPANVLLASGGREPPDASARSHDCTQSGGSRLPLAACAPKITDFGLAKLLEEADSVRTRTGTIVGTPNYMAPEQAAGRNKEVSTASDVYALGAILYELLTGRPPFKADTPLEVLRKVESEEPAPPSRMRPNLPRDLETVCLKCLQKEPGRRFTTAGALAEDLRHFLAGEPVAALPISPAQRLMRWCRCQPLVASLVASVAVLVTGIAIVGPIAAVSFRRQRDRAISLKQDADQAKQDAIEKLRGSYLAQAQAGRWSGQPGRRFKSLEALKAAALIRPSLELRNEAVACMPLVDLRVAKSWPAHLPWPGGFVTMAFDAECQRYAEVGESGFIRVRRVADDSEVLSRAIGHAKGCYMQFSPDGRYLSLKQPSGFPVQVWDLTTGEIVVHVETAKEPGHPDFSPDNRRFVSGTGNGSIRIFDLPSGTEIQTLEVGSGPVNSVFHPTGEKLAVHSWRVPSIEIVDATSGDLLRKLPYPQDVNGFAWHPDGKLLAAACADTSVHIVDADTGKQQAVLEGHQNEVTSCAFNHAGNLLASSSWDGITRLWEPVSGRQLVTIAGTFLRLSRDGRWLALAKGTEIGLWEVSDGRECRTLQSNHDQGDGPWSADIHANGNLMATSYDDGVRLWDLATGKEVAWLPVGQSRFAIFDATGESLVTNGAHGTHRWPIAADTKGGLLRVGPPDRLLEPLPRPDYHPGISRDGQWFGAVSGPNEVVLFNLERPTDKLLLDGHLNVSTVAISPDRKWVVTGTQHGTGIRVWDAQSGKLVQELTAGGYASAVFSPDGERMWTRSSPEGTRCWEVGSWQSQVVRTYAGDIVLSHDGSMLALAHDRLIELIDTATGQELASLPAQNDVTAEPLCFSPDGTQLVVRNLRHRLIQVWDLRAIRQQLAAMNLDWGRAAYPTPAESGARETLRVELQLGDLAELAKLTGSPRLAESLNNEAWRLATSQDHESRDPARAVELAKQAVEIDPFKGGSWNTLGVAHYRAGDWPAAIAALEKSMELRDGGDSFDWFFMALAHWQLDQRVKAREWFERAVAWMQQHRPHDEDLRRFHIEAAELLGPRDP